MADRVVVERDRLYLHLELVRREATRSLVVGTPLEATRSTASISRTQMPQAHVRVQLTLLHSLLY